MFTNRRVTITPVASVKKGPSQSHGIDTLLAETAKLSAQASNPAHYHAIKKRTEAEVLNECEAQAKAPFENTQRLIEEKLKAIPLDANIGAAFNEFNFFVPQVIQRNYRERR